MRILLTNIISFYIKISVFFSQIEFALLLLLNGVRIQTANRNLIREGEIRDRVVSYIYQPTERTFLHIAPIQIDEEFTAKEHWHIVKEQYTNKWHIGLVVEVFDCDDFLVLCVDLLVSSSSFFRFPMNALKMYLIQVAKEDDESVILSSDIQHNVYGSVFQSGDVYDLPDSLLVLKTYWIRIIQRRWRRLYSERMRRLKLRGGLKAQRQFEICGNYVSSNAMSANIKTD